MADLRRNSDTIFAVSSGRPPAAIAVLRISGPAAGAVLDRIGQRPVPRLASLRAIRDEHGQLLDRALLLWFPGPRSATGEDLLELHLHGGIAVVAAVRAWLTRIGLRDAEPGEFTRRALLAGRLNLAEVEGLADLLAAETETQRRDALARAEGVLGRRLADWTAQVVNLAAQLEAAIDYDDAEETGVITDVRPGVRALRDEIAHALALPSAERLRDGLRVVIVGPVNAGKSTLFNALLGRDAAIVSPLPGTTRDINEAPVAFAGIAFVLSDTAGLREADEPIERLGIARALAREEAADLIIDLREDAVSTAVRLAVRSKADAEFDDDGRLAVSGVTGAGLDELVQALVTRAVELLPRTGEVSLNRRHRTALTDVVNALGSALEQADPLLQAEHLAQARRALDAVTGTAHLDAVLDAVFSQFCLGK